MNFKWLILECQKTSEIKNQINDIQARWHFSIITNDTDRSKQGMKNEVTLSPSEGRSHRVALP